MEKNVYFVVHSNYKFFYRQQNIYFFQIGINHIQDVDTKYLYDYNIIADNQFNNLYNYIWISRIFLDNLNLKSYTEDNWT